MGLEQLTFRLRGERFNPVRHRHGLEIVKMYSKIYFIFCLTEYALSLVGLTQNDAADVKKNRMGDR